MTASPNCCNKRASGAVGDAAASVAASSAIGLQEESDLRTLIPLNRYRAAVRASDGFMSRMLCACSSVEPPA